MSNVEVRRPARRLRSLRGLPINLGRYAAMAGLLVPVGVIEKRLPAEVADDPFTPITLFRALTPSLCLLLALVITRTSLRPRGTRELLLSVYLLVVVASAAWSLAPGLTLLKAAHLVVAHALLVLVARHWQSAEQALDEMAAVTYGVVALALGGALLAPSGAFQAANDNRLFAVFPALQPVVLGLISTCAVILLAAGVGPQVSRRPPFRAVLLVAALATLLLTRSRSAIVLVLVGLVVLAALRGRRAFAVGLLCAAGAAGAVLLTTPAGAAVAAVLAGGPNRFSLSSLGGRLPLWADAWHVVADRPLLGFGYFAGHRFGEYAERFAATTGRNDPYIDGTWTETLLDLGLLGVAALGCFVAVSAWCVVRAGKVDSAAMHTLLLILLVYSIQDFTVQQPGYTMFLLGGLLLLPITERGSTSAASASLPAPPKVV